MALNWTLAGDQPTFAERLAGFKAGDAERQQMQQRQARTTAGQQYVGGDRQAAAQTLAGAGEFGAAVEVADDERERQRQDQLHEAQTWKTALPVLANLARARGPEGALPAFRQVAGSLGGTPEELQQVEAAFMADPMAFADAVGRASDTVLREVGGNLVAYDPNTNAATEVYRGPEKDPSAPAGYRWGNGGALEFIPGGPADPQTIGGNATTRRRVVVDNPTPSRARGGGGRGGAPKLPSGFILD